MKIYKLKEIPKVRYEKILNRASGNYEKIIPEVQKIINQVKIGGDEAVKQIQNQYWGLKIDSLLVSKKEIESAYKFVNGDFIKGIQQMIKNIRLVHKNQLKVKIESIVKSEKGIKVWREWRGIEKVGLYVPGGKAIYPSSILMTAIPAQIAECKDIVVCTPPSDNGVIPAPTLVAADMLGLSKIFKIGGSEAVAAMTFGTETVPRVYKIFGAGNSYVTAAKILVSKIIAIDMPAGPSEVLIIADETANPKFIAADLLADAEHGEDSACVLITTSTKIAKNTIKEINKQIENLETKDRILKSFRNYGLITTVDSLNEAFDFVNKYAPEHLEIMLKNANNLVKKVKNVGSIFLGNFTCKASGDYATGANHVLPTGGMAKMYSPLGVDSFGRWIQVQKCSKLGLSKIRKTIEIIADIEKLPAHGNSCKARFN